jgi:hypothetical protein
MTRLYHQLLINARYYIKFYPNLFSLLQQPTGPLISWTRRLLQSAHVAQHLFDYDENVPLYITRQMDGVSATSLGLQMSLAANERIAKPKAMRPYKQA